MVSCEFHEHGVLASLVVMDRGVLGILHLCIDACISTAFSFSKYLASMTSAA